MEDGFPELYTSQDSNYSTSSLPVELSHVVSLYHSQVGHCTFTCLNIATGMCLNLCVCVHAKVIMVMCDVTVGRYSMIFYYYGNYSWYVNNCGEISQMECSK